MTKRADRQLDDLGRRQRAEALIREQASRTGEDSAASSPDVIRKALHELQVHQIELEMQNEELHRAQVEIDAARARYICLFDLAPVGYCSLSEEGLILEANLTLATLLGLDRGALVKQPVSRFILNEDQDICYRHRRRLLETGEPQESDLRLVRPGGAPFWAHMVGTAARAEDGPTVCHIAISDITERKQMEGALRESEARFRHLLQGVPNIAVQGHGPDGTTRYWNDASEHLYGYTAQEAIGRNLLDLIIPAEMRAEVEQAIQQMAATGEPIPASEVSLMHKDGSRVSVLSSHAIVQIPGHAPELFCIDIDITKRKLAEEELRRSRSELESATRLTHVGHWYWNIKTNEMRWTEEVFRLFGATIQPGVLNLADFAARVHPDDWPELERKAMAAIADKAVYRHEYRILQPNGSIRSCAALGQPVLDGNGEVIAFQGAIQDITERQRAQAEREKLEEQLRAVQKMEAIGSLAGGVAHDFNNLLSVIQGYTALVLEELPPGSPLMDDLLEVKKAGERAEALTRQLLAFSRKLILQPVALNLNEIAEGVAKMLRRILGEDIALVQILEPDLGIVRADPGQLEQVLMNLVVNARDAMPTGGKLTIETANVEIDAEYAARHVDMNPGSYIQLAVSDTGCGMDERTKARLFEPFFTTKPKGKGTGLGLSTVHGIVKQSGGCIWVSSDVGKGTTFTIYLPRETAATAATAVTRAVAGRPLTGTETILVVEDEESLRRFAKRALETAGYTVLTAAGGNEAIAACAQYDGDVHLLLTDVVMPEMNGRELAQELLKMRQRLKIIYMSGHTDNAIVHHGVLDPGTQFLGKPFTGNDVTRKVREVLDQATADAGHQLAGEAKP